MTGTNIQGINIISTIVPTNPADTYATHDSIYGKGGWREVDTLDERDSIPTERRRRGMVVFVRETLKSYQLRNSDTNGGWVPFPGDEDASEIINSAIADGKINIDLTDYVTKATFEERLLEYYTSADVDSALETLESEITEWVESKGYLTEHQSLADYVNYETLASILDNYVLTSVLEETLSSYYTKDETDEKLADYVTNDEAANYLSENYYNKTETDEKLADYVTNEAAESYLNENYYTKGETDEKLADYVTNDEATNYLSENYYNKTETDEKLADYVTNDEAASYLAENYYNKTETDEKLADYVTNDAAQSYLEENYYTKTEADEKLDEKLANYLTNDEAASYLAENYYSKTETDEKLANYLTNDEAASYLAENYYSKTETDEKLADYLTNDEAASYLNENYYNKAETDEKLTNYYTKEEADEKLAEKVSTVDFVEVLTNYSTTEQIEKTLSEYATLNQVKEYLEEYYTKDEVDELLKNLNVDLSDYYTKEECDAKFLTEVALDGYVSSEELTSILANYVLSSDLSTYVASTLDGYYTKEEVDDKLSDYFTTKAAKNYLSENYYDKTEVDEKLADILTIESVQNYLDENYYNKTETDEKLAEKIDNSELTEALANYVTLEQAEKTLSNYVTVNQAKKYLDDYYTKDEVDELLKNLNVDLSDYYTKEECDAKFLTEVALDGYVSSEELTSILANYVLSSDLSVYVTTEDLTNILVDYVKTSSLSDYVTQEALDTAVSNITTTVTNLADAVTQIQNADYATRAYVADQIANSGHLTVKDLQGYATELWVQDYVSAISGGSSVDLSSYQKKEDYDLETTSKTIVGAINEINARETDSYSKEEIDSKFDEIHIPEKVSELENDAGYLTEHQDISGLATKEELETAKEEIETQISEINIPEKVSELENDAGYITAAEIETKADKSDVDQLTETVETISSEIEEIKNAEADYVTEEELDAKGYLTSIPEEYVTEEILASKGYITETEVDTKLEEKANVSDLDNYALKTDIPEKVSELENDADYATRAYVADQIANSGHLTVKDLQGYATELWVQDYVSTISGGSSVDLSSYQKKEDYDLETTSKTIVGAINEINARETDSYSKEEIDSKFDEIHIPEKVSELENDAEYITIADVEAKNYLTEADITDLVTTETLDSALEEKANAEDVYTKTEADSIFTTQLLTSSKGTAEIFNESDGGGSRFKNTEEGVTSYVGTNDGSFDGLYAQIYARPDDTKVGTRINIYTDMACYCTTADSAYGVKAPEYELAVKGDFADYYDKEEIDEKLQTISETGVDLSDYYNKEAVNELLAEKADAEDVYTKTEADSIFTTQLLTSSKGTAEIFNESDGGGSRFKNTEEGVTSYVGTNDGSFDGLYAQIYARPDDTKIGTRINIYTDMACYCTTADSAYGVKAPEYELAVKGDFADYYNKEEINEKLSDVTVDLSDYYTKEEVDEAIKNAEVDLSDYYTKEESEEKFTIQELTTESGSFAGLAEIFNESDGGGARFTNTNTGVKSYVGVHNGDDGGIYAQIYAKDDASGAGTRINVYTDMVCYSSTATSAAGWKSEDTEIAVKGDFADYYNKEEIDEKLQTISETGVDLSDYYNKEAVNELLAEKANAEDVYTKTEADSIFTTQLLTSSKGTAEIFNESDGGGSRFKNTEEGVTSYVGTNDGSFDGLYAQIYARPDDTKIGTRINIYTDMACYCTTADSAYGVKAPEYELAVKGDLAEFCTKEEVETNYVTREEYNSKVEEIESLKEQLASIQDKLDKVESAISASQIILGDPIDDDADESPN